MSSRSAKTTFGRTSLGISRASRKRNWRPICSSRHTRRTSAQCGRWRRRSSRSSSARPRAGKGPPYIAPTLSAAENVSEAATKSAAAVQRTVKRLTGPKENETRKAVQAARRSMRNAASRPKREHRRRPMSQTEAQTEFADALHRAGLRPKGAPIMDGKKHRVPVEGDRRGRLSGTYIGHLDDHPAGYIHNFKTGEEIRWRASRPNREMTPEERDRARQAAPREQTVRERRHREAVVSHRANAIWNLA